MTIKESALRESGCYNNNHAGVTAAVFETNPFFDKMDIIQVKYEMLRAGSLTKGSITEVSNTFGFSRKSYYKINSAFQNGGIDALLPKKMGPKRAHKLTDEVSKFIDSYGGGSAKPNEISAALKNEMGISVSIRTIYRYLKKN